MRLSLFIGFTWLAVVGPAFAASNEIIVRFKDGVENKARQAHILGYRAQKTRFMVDQPAHPVKKDKFKIFKKLAVTTLEPGENPQDVIREYESNPDVQYAVPNLLYQVTSVTPNDSYFQYQWALTGRSGINILPHIDVLRAWDITTGSDGIVVAVVDTGIDYSHEDLAGNMWLNPGEIANNGQDDDHNGYVDDRYGYDFHRCDEYSVTGVCIAPVPRDANPMDDNSHGTHVAGIIGAVGNNGKGVSGVAWNVQLMALKFLNRTGGGSAADAIDALRYAMENGADIINNSWTGGHVLPLEEVIKEAYENNIIIVAAAGNIHEERVNYPAGYNQVVAVAASTFQPFDEKAFFSTFGRHVDISAPGEFILSAIPQCHGSNCAAYNGRYKEKSGTSMSTPFVSGAFALLKSRFPQLNNSALIEKLLRTTDNIDAANPNYIGKLGSGRLNVYRALTENPLPGDYNRDCVVNQTDYNLWRANFGRTVSPFNGADGNGDGRVDAADETVWRDHKSATCPANNSVTDPEISPTTGESVSAAFVSVKKPVFNPTRGEKAEIEINAGGANVSALGLVPASTEIRVRISDRRGYRIADFHTTVSGDKQLLTWDGRDKNGSTVVSDVYYGQVIGEGKIQKFKLVVIK